MTLSKRYLRSARERVNWFLLRKEYQRYRPDAQTKGKQGAMKGIETRLYNDGEGSFSCKKFKKRQVFFASDEIREGQS